MKLRLSDTNSILFIISSLLFSYTTYKAIHLSITWDEAYSYLEYVRNTIFIEEAPGGMSANNHWLNTWLCIYFVKWFGVNEFVLRLPSLIAHILFLYSSATLVKSFSDKWIVILSFLIINLNPYLLDFFSLSRGYALSVSLMLWSILYLYKYLSNDYKIKYAAFSLIIGALAVMANFVLLNYFVVLFALLFCFEVYYHYTTPQHKEEKWKSIIIRFSIINHLFAIAVLFIVPKLFKLRAADALYYGLNNGFWQDTVYTSVQSFLYGLDYGRLFPIALKAIIVLIIFAGILYSLAQIIKKQQNANSLFIFSLVLLIVLTALSTIVQHKFLHTLYLFDRTTLFYMVLMPLLFVFTLIYLVKNIKYKQVVLSVFCLVFLFHSVRAFNFSYVWEWKANADIKKIMKDIENQKTKLSEFPLISIGMPLTYEAGFNYYRAVNKMNWLVPADRDNQIHDLRDLWILPADTAKKYLGQYDTVAVYNTNKDVLAKPKINKKNFKTIYRNKYNYDFSDEGVYRLIPENKYGAPMQITVPDSVDENNTILLVGYKIKVPYEALKNTAIEVSIGNEEYSYPLKKSLLKELIIKKQDWNEVYFSVIVPSGIKPKDVIKAYIWNESKNPIYIKWGEIKWIKND